MPAASAHTCSKRERLIEKEGRRERRLPSSALKRTVCDKFAIKNASIDKAAADGAATTVATLAVY